MVRFINRIREKFNLSIYGSKDSVLRGLKIATLLASAIGVLNLVYYYGFPQSPESKEISLYIIKGVFVIFIISYLTRFLYSFHPLTFLLKTWFEGLLMLLLIYDGISLYLFNVPLLENLFNRFGVETFTHFYVLFIQMYMMVIIGLEAAKASRYLTQIDLRPSTTFMLSFLILILTGAGMIMLPEMTTIDGSMPFIDALFTSASASCVTGLMVVDASTYFTFKGHVVILILIQLGGLGIISFAAFFASFLSGGNVGVKHASIIMDYLSPESQYNTKAILRQIILTTLSIEIIGAIVMFSLWNPAIEFNGTGDKIFQSIFHSIAAFCNAGISTFHGGLYNEQLRTSYILHIAFMLLMVLGGIGFPVIHDLFGIKHLRTRLKYPWKQWDVGTKISIYTTGGLVFVCSIVYFFLEQDNTLSGMDTGESIITSVFQTVTRTGGYNTVDISQIGIPSLIMDVFNVYRWLISINSWRS
ncbi:MAG: ATPase [Bacteroidia bacterium]|nr:ATPase [Bacteroidia bacterium]